MPKLANRVAANARRDVVPGFHRFHVDRLTEEVRRGDPVLAHDFAGASRDKRRKKLEESSSPSIRQAARQLGALLAGEPVAVLRPNEQSWPAVAEIDWLAKSDDIDAMLARPRMVYVFPDDTVEPA